MQELTRHIGSQLKAVRRSAAVCGGLRARIPQRKRTFRAFPRPDTLSAVPPVTISFTEENDR
jgi:hypothetical protein